MAYDVETLMDNLTSAFTTEYERNYVDAQTTPHPTNVAKLMQGFVDGFWADTAETISDIRTNLHLPTMEGGVLDKWARVVNLERRLNETDAEYRIRISGAIRRRFAGTDANSIIEFAAAAIGADADDILYRENNSNNPYVPAQFTIEFDLAILGGLGFNPSEYQAVVDLLDEVLTDMSAAGVKGNVVPAGGAEYDTDDYDQPGDVYGS